jgi:bifunctional polynucleotide phosphatase/kinase
MFSCKIVSCDPDYLSIQIEHCKPLVIGRGPLTRIKDLRLSRNHGTIAIQNKFKTRCISFNFQFTVELVADCEKGLLCVKLIGANACKAGTSIIKAKDESVQLKHGEIIELLEKQFPFRVEFIPDPNQVPSSVKSSSSSEEIMVGKQTTLNNFITTKRKSTSAEDVQDPSFFAKKQKTEDTWEEIDNGKLIIFTSDGVQHKSKVFQFILSLANCLIISLY